MEVHAHTHTERKKFTHYLWEFFMLFLAVTLGFFVENLREHYVEHEKEIKYIKLLYNDLKIDTSRINGLRRIKQFKAGKLDSLRELLYSPKIQDYSVQIYYFSYFVNFNQKFEAQDATIQQLQSSGSLRYFSNPELYINIIQYYKNCKVFFDREIEAESRIVYPENVISKLFDAKILMGDFKISLDIFHDKHIPAGDPKLLSTDKQLINEYYLFISNKKFTNDLSLFFLNQTENGAKGLLELIKKEYHLK